MWLGITFCCTREWLIQSMTDRVETANKLMKGFDRDERRLAMIWAAKNQVCVKCLQPKNKPCINLSKRRIGVEQETIWPHAERVDWDHLIGALRRKGYREV